MGAVAWLLVAVLFVCLLVAGAACSRSAATPPAPAVPVVQTAGQLARLDRQQVRELLRRIATTAPPAKRKMGAMCYDMAGPSLRAEYVCPTCGERTLYEKEATRVVQFELTECRRAYAELRMIAGEAIVFDESQFCRKCQPDVKKPSLALRVAFEDQQTCITENVTADDLRLLREFLTGQLLHVADNEAETPLQQHLPRIEKLLGTEDK